MKKTPIVLATLLALSGFAFAAGTMAPASEGSLFAPGNITAQVDLGSGFFWGLDVSGGAEYGLGSFKVANTVPLTYGVAGRIGYGGWTLLGYNYSDVAISALATLHLSWKHALPDVKWLSKIESYIGLGLGVDIHSETDSYYNGTHLAIASLEGNNWYFAPSVALNIEEGYFGYGYGGWGRIGILLKL